MPAELIASLKRKGKVQVPQVTVTTDFETHRAVGHMSRVNVTLRPRRRGQDTCRALELMLRARPVTGIPVHPGFGKKFVKPKLLEKYGVAAGRPVVLQLAGGFGVGPIQRVHEELLAVETPIELIVVCGRNQKVASDLAKVKCPPRHRRHVIGFTSEMHELMALADVVVTKPGGLTSSECLAAGAVMVIINPIPGQESRNADYLLEKGVAVKANNLPTLRYKINELLEDTPRLWRMKAMARGMGRPEAAAEILRRAEKCTGG